MAEPRFRAVERIVQSALEKPVGEREAFVRAACGAHAALCDEALSLLKQKSTTDGLLEQPSGTSSASGRMTLAVGTRLGSYEITSQIGADGMGEVYRARHTKVPQTVAIKVLPARSRSNLKLQELFDREAQAIAALNHPHICTFHYIDRHDDIDFIVMEHIEGEDLRARLKRGPLPVEETVQYVRQVAEALTAAHQKGLVHRDIKPSNIMIAPGAKVKVIDFGLARLGALLRSEGLAATGAQSEPGVVVGTPYYMSPEQARGLPVDQRTDIFSLGAVMFECLTGRLPFDGKMRDDYLQHLLSGTPRTIGELRDDVPADLQALILRCLERDVSRRIESATKLTAELDRIASVRVAGSTVVPSLRWRVIAAMLVAAAVFAVLWRVNDNRSLGPPFEQLTFIRARIGAARFVADGRGVVYSEEREIGKPELLHIDLAESPMARPLGFAPGTELLAARTGELAVSVNRRLIISERFAGTLAVAPFGSSSPREEQNDVDEADWDPSGKQMAVVRSPGGIGGTSLLEYPIGTKRYETGNSIRFPRISRDGTRIAFLEDPFGSGEAGHVSVLNLADNRVAVVTKNWRSARGLAWSADGLEIWFTAGDSRTNRILYAVKPDDGFKPDSVGPRLVQDPPGSLTLFDIAPDGRVLVTVDDDRRALVGAMTGQTERDLSWFDDSGLADVADDGRWVLFSDRFGVYVRGTDGSRAVRLANIPAFADDLSSDGKRVLATTTSDPFELVILPVAAGTPQVVPRHNITAYSGARWFPDGRIIFTGMEAGRERRSYVQSLTGGPPRPVTPEGTWVVSLDGTGKMGAAIGYTQPGISIIPMDGGPSSMVPGSQRGDRPVAWTDDGKALWIFRRSEVPAQVIRLDIATGNRQIWKTLPSDVTGLYSVTEFAITPSGSAYYYSYKRLLSELYQAKGLR